MVELIVGKKGKGKTKVLLDKVNGAIKEANGSIVYLDKSTKHMYELNNKVRLIDVSVYPIKNADEFVGFVCGIISQDHDLEQVYLDSFLHKLKIFGGWFKTMYAFCSIVRKNYSRISDKAAYIHYAFIFKVFLVFKVCNPV